MSTRLEFVQLDSQPTDTIPAGEVLLYSFNGGLYYRVGTTSTEITQTEPVFGSNFFEATDNTEVTYSSGTLFEAYTFNSPSLDAGEYRIAATVQYKPASNTANDLFQMRIDGAQIGQEYEDEGKDSQPDIRRLVPLRGYYTLDSNGPISLGIFAARDGSGNGTIFSVSVEIWRVE